MKADDEALPPHPPLTDYYADEAARHSWVRRVFDTTAGDYDRVEGLMAFGSGPWYRRQALQRSGLTAGMRVLDVGTGTGLTAVEAARLSGSGANIVGVDPSPGMLANARMPQGMQVIEGRAEELPVPDASFDFVSMGYALRHVSDLRPVFSEFHRVLKPGGRACMLEITRPTSAGATLWLSRLHAHYRAGNRACFRPLARHPPLMRSTGIRSRPACRRPSHRSVARGWFVSVERHVVLGIFSEYVAIKAQ